MSDFPDMSGLVCWIQQILPVNRDPYDTHDCAGCKSCKAGVMHKCHLTGRVNQCTVGLSDVESGD